MEGCLEDSVRRRLAAAVEEGIVIVHDHEAVSERLTWHDIPIGVKVQYVATHPATKRRESVIEGFLMRGAQPGLVAHIRFFRWHDEWPDEHAFRTYMTVLAVRIGAVGTSYAAWRLVDYAPDEQRVDMGICEYVAPLRSITLHDAAREFQDLDGQLHLQAAVESLFASLDFGL
jgi:hypothetical protein